MKGELEIASVHLPLWAHGMETPHEWLFSSRAQQPAVVVGFIAGTLALTRTDVRNVAFQLLDVLWLETTAVAVANVPFLDNKRAVFEERVAIDDAVLASLPPNVVLIFGFVPTAVEGDLYLHLREKTDTTETILLGTLQSVTQELVKVLVTRGVQRAPERLPLCRRLREIPRVQHAAFAAVCENLCHLIAAHPSTAKMTPMTKKQARAAVELAHDLARAAPDSDVAQLAWFASAIYCNRAGHLAKEQRRTALDSLREYIDPDEPIARLSPGILHGLGEVETARTYARDALAALGAPCDAYRSPSANTAEAHYRAWLQRVIDK